MTRRHHGRIYFIEAVGLDRVKIGWTNREIGSRLRDLNGASPVDLRLVGAIYGTMRQERGLHRQFERERIRGEWFRTSADLADFINGALGCGLLMGSGPTKTEQKAADSSPPSDEKE